MLYIFTEEYETAAGFIEYYRLKKNVKETLFQVFRSQEQKGGRGKCAADGVELVITQKGAVRAAMAAGYVMGQRGTEHAAGEDIFLCVEPGELMLYAEIKDTGSGRYFYPDMHPAHPFEEGSTDSRGMAAWYEALSCFGMQHQLVFAAAGPGREQIGRLCDFLGGFYEEYGKRHPFHHVYIERKLEGQRECEEILAKLPKSRVLWINHYKDVFNRKNQSLTIQKRSPALVLAGKEGRLIYPGSKECQSFGNEYFYYTSSIMNCLFDCEYCYLQGMYPSADVVAFTNIEDIFSETDTLLLEHPVYLCVSYDTDLAALEGLMGYCKRWIDYAAGKENLTLELRTKAALPESLMAYCRKKECENIIFAFTLTPEMVQLSYEHGTAPIAGRLASIKQAAQWGMKIRVCFDPLIVKDGAAEAYSGLIRELFGTVSRDSIYDVSLGGFRVPADYMKRMRKRRPESELLSYPFVTEGKSCCYGSPGDELMEAVEEMLKEYVPADKIFRWDGQE